MAIQWPLKKIVTVSGKDVEVIASKRTLTNHRTVLEVTAVVGNLSHQMNLTIGIGNSNYSQANLQADFDAHCQRVAAEAIGLANTDTLTESLV